MKQLSEKAKSIKLLILDVDGVLTDGKLYIGNDEQAEYKAFNIKDGLGLRLLMQTGVMTAIITGKISNIVSKRMEQLGITHVYQGHANKLPIFEQLLKQLNLSYSEVAYIGDDLQDLPLLSRVGLAIAVDDACEYVKSNVHYVTHAKGGDGAAREACELIMKAQGHLEAIQKSFLTDGSRLEKKEDSC